MKAFWELLTLRNSEISGWVSKIASFYVWSIKKYFCGRTTMRVCVCESSGFRVHPTYFQKLHTTSRKVFRALSSENFPKKWRIFESYSNFEIQKFRSESQKSLILYVCVIKKCFWGRTTLGVGAFESSGFPVNATYFQKLHTTSRKDFGAL